MSPVWTPPPEPEIDLRWVLASVASSRVCAAARAVLQVTLSVSCSSTWSAARISLRAFCVRRHASSGAARSCGCACCIMIRCVSMGSPSAIQIITKNGRPLQARGEHGICLSFELELGLEPIHDLHMMMMMVIAMVRSQIEI